RELARRRRNRRLPRPQADPGERRGRADLRRRCRDEVEARRQAGEGPAVEGESETETEGKVEACRRADVAQTEAEEPEKEEEELAADPGSASWRLPLLEGHSARDGGRGTTMPHAPPAISERPRARIDSPSVPASAAASASANWPAVSNRASRSLARPIARTWS